MSLDTDLAAMINPSTPGYVAATVDGVATTGLFDAAWEDTFGMEGTGPSLFCRLSPVAAAVEGDTVVIGSTSYEITSVRPDGFGGVRFKLSEV